MTDEKKELPWAIVPNFGHNLNVEEIGRGEYALIPEPEALRLHALDERVKKFEEGCKCLFSALNGSEITLKERNGIVLSKEIDLLRKSILFEAIDLLREAMGEDR